MKKCARVRVIMGSAPNGFSAEVLGRAYVNESAQHDMAAFQC